MAVLDILVYPDPRLKQVSREVTAFDEGLRAFLGDLEDTLRASPGCVGIAAPQVGRFERILLIDASCKTRIQNHGRLVLINPSIALAGEFDVGREGCLSVPDYTGNVARARDIVLKAKDEFGQEQEFNMTGFEARLVQHEMDHLEGLLFLDRLVSRRNGLFPRKNYQKADS